MRISNRFLIWFLVIITVHNFVLLSYLYLENRYELSLELNERSRLLDSLSIDYQEIIVLFANKKCFFFVVIRQN